MTTLAVALQASIADRSRVWIAESGRPPLSRSRPERLAIVRPPTTSICRWNDRVSERAIPSYYLRCYDDGATVIAEAKAHPTRAEEVMAIERELLELYHYLTLDVKPEQLEDCGGAFYTEAATPLIASLQDGRSDVRMVEVRKGSWLPRFFPNG